jgi:hypothetical protein
MTLCPFLQTLIGKMVNPMSSWRVKGTSRSRTPQRIRTRCWSLPQTASRGNIAAETATVGSILSTELKLVQAARLLVKLASRAILLRLATERTAGEVRLLTRLILDSVY